MRKNRQKFTYRSVSTYYHKDSDYETNTEPSQTIQGDAYTIAELFERSQTGGNMPPIQRAGQYHEDPTHETDVRVDAPDFDLADATSIKIEIEEKQKQSEESKAINKIKRGESELAAKAQELADKHIAESEAPPLQAKNEPIASETSKAVVK